MPCQSRVDLFFSVRGPYRVPPSLYHASLTHAESCADPWQTHTKSMYDQCRSGPKRLGSCMDSIATCMGPTWIRLSQVRIGSGVDRIQSIPIQVGCKRVGSELDWIEPDMDPIWIRLSQARVGYGLNLSPSIPSTGRMQAFGIRHGLA